MTTTATPPSQRASAKAPSEHDCLVGERIRAFRQAKGMSQMMLAAAVGVTYQQIQKYEAGGNRVSGSRLQAIAQALGVPIGAFFEETAASEGGNELYALLDKPGAQDLMRAYTSITDADLRRDVLELVRTAVKLERR